MSLFNIPLFYQRRSTRVVQVGNVGVGGTEPLRIQSMLTSDTCDLVSVMAEIEALSRTPCEMIRLTVPNHKAVEALPEIRHRMRDAGLEIPLIADIHFNPQLAVNSCEFVEKIRINPGNYADSKRFMIREYTEQQYQEELNRIEQKIKPLITQLKKYQRALRIGTNHGSLSDRVINRYGDTPEGMVESALEFIRIFRKYDYHDIIISMKSSNPLVMAQAYRLLALRMDEEGMDYPLHLGVTEAGNGLDGRIKSAAGIASLLCDGLGDTIRVSLTEPSVQEIPAAREILEQLRRFQQNTVFWPGVYKQIPLRSERRVTESVTISETGVGGDQTFRLLKLDSGTSAVMEEGIDALLPVGQCQQVTSLEEWQQACSLGKNIVLSEQIVRDGDLAGWIKSGKNSLSPRLILVQGEHPLYPVRRLTGILDSAGARWPVGFVLPENAAFRWALAGELGALISENTLDCLVCPESGSAELLLFARVVLQATRVRLFKADFISCPSCGRTFFDLQQTTEAIKLRTAHLKGVKIGIMGCVVNGPGEMADADFGYVGSGEGRISLYHGQECVRRNIPEKEAVEHLIELIKQHGKWVDP
ncbi:MAG: (E)-4-hydroxy-3-methylbut-2-enyl-diphosphate synthase [SAR324 cluster bacterium]|nr:(E)-4-hydroxy-3-methylbut-2-enyl-diphosphate synthase [SAR324 cluster bacterium]